MLEVEVKYRNTDPAVLEERLRALGAAHLESRTESDHYFNAPDRDLRQTDEAFRMRRIGTSNRLTYKGPKRTALTKTRLEIEVPLGEGDTVSADAERMLVCLGYRLVAVVTKQRSVYTLDRGGYHIEICLDDVERVGSFVEVEVLAREEEFDEAGAAVLALAAELGLTEPERRSYLGLYLGVV